MSLFDEFGAVRVAAVGKIFRRTRAVCVLLVGVCFGLGCASGPRIAASPMSPEEQQRAVLKIVPLGTPRVEVVEKLKGAGIQFTPGTSETIYYCDVWNREDGAHWQMDVALLFDSEGKLYQTRRAQADTGLASAADARAATKATQPGVRPAGMPQNPANAASQTPVAPGEPAARSRTPFQKRPDMPAPRR